ncbi:hypothetical protein [Methylobacterium sp. CM6257]
MTERDRCFLHFPLEAADPADAAYVCPARGRRGRPLRRCVVAVAPSARHLLQWSAGLLAGAGLVFAGGGAGVAGAVLVVAGGGAGFSAFFSSLHAVSASKPMSGSKKRMRIGVPPWWPIGSKERNSTSVGSDPNQLLGVHRTLVGFGISPVNQPCDGSERASL